ncbi:MAG: DsbA family protein [Rhizobiales bacterium]|nr:DsbA family protein [Hyphomicrobiales bacterium]
MAEPNLIYVADPMCSWCWGFSPVIGQITERFGKALPIRFIMGGLRPGTTKPLDEAGKRTIREHWEHVHEASGQPFNMDFFERDGFVYDTEPASKAVVVARRSAIEKGLACLRLVHAAFYAENRDVTNEEVLADVATEVGLDREQFMNAFRSDEATQETWADFGIGQRAGITGFPTLLAGAGDRAEYAIVTQGYQPADRIVPVLERWLQGL